MRSREGDLVGCVVERELILIVYLCFVPSLRAILQDMMVDIDVFGLIRRFNPFPS